MFGIVDLYLARIHGGPTSRTGMESGGSADSRFGFRGFEDLGGGMSARFVLEGGIDPDGGNETSTSIRFTRQSFLGLSGAWGSVDLGRMYTPMFQAMSRADPFALNTDFSPMNLGGAYFPLPRPSGVSTAPNAFAPRSNGTIRYRSAASHAVTIDLAYSFGGGISSSSQRSGELYGGSISWKREALHMAYALQNVRSGSASAPVIPPVATRYQAVSVAYDVTQRLRLSAIATHTDSQRTAAAKLWSLGARWQVDATSSLLFGFARRQLEGVPEYRHALTLGYDYALSRRTVLYGRFLRASDKGLPMQQAAPAVATGGSLLGLGIRHHF